MITKKIIQIEIDDLPNNSLVKLIEFLQIKEINFDYIEKKSTSNCNNQILKIYV